MLVGPVLVVLIRLFSIDPAGLYHLTQTLLPLYLRNTALVTLGVAMLSLILGVSAAWLISTCQFPFRRQLEWLLILPLAIPTFISAIAYSGLTDYAGPVRIFLRNVAWVDDLYIDMMNVPGVIFVMSAVLYPYVYLTSRAAFVGQSGHLIEASRTLGQSFIKTFIRIIIPTAWPAIFSGLSLVIMEVLNDYGTVKYYGVPTFTTGIFKSWLSLGDLPSALFLSSILVVFVLIILVVEEKARGLRKFTDESTPPRLSRYRLRGWKKIAGMTLVLLPFIIGFIIPVFQMLWWLMLTYRDTVWSNFYLIAANTMTLAFFASFLIIILGILLAYAYRLLRPIGFWRYTSKFTILGYAMPGAVIAVGIIAIVLMIDASLLYAGVYALMFGYMVRFFAVGFSPVDSGFRKLSISLDDAAITMGSGSLRNLFHIHLPLLKPSLIAGLMMAFVDITKELPLTLILRPFNFDTLAVNAFQYATDEMAPESAAASLLIIFVGVIPIYLLNRTIRRMQA